MKRKSILLVLCIGMVLTSCKNIKTLNDSDVKNEKSQKKTVMEIQDKGYDLPIDEKKKKEVVNDCEENMEAIRDIYSEFNGMQEADQNVARQMMDRMKEIIKQNGNPVIGSDHYSVMDNYQKMEQFLKSTEQEEKGSVILSGKYKSFAYISEDGKLSEDGNVFECCQARRKRQRNFI